MQPLPKSEELAAFRDAWVAVGREEDLPRPGAWLKAPLTPAGVLVVRQPDGELKAFHAVCTHRGAAFVDGEEGEGARFTCPYHGFAFELDGRACAQVKDLAEVRVGSALGFVFVALSAAAPPLEEALGELPPWLLSADLSRLRRARRLAYDVEARWNLVLENLQESLHFASVHPALEALTPPDEAETWTPDRGGPWMGGTMPLAAHAETVSRSARRHGRPFIVPERDRRVVHDAMRFPNLLTSLQPDYLLTFNVFPTAATRTRIVASTYVREDAPEDALPDVLDLWTAIYDEDKVACERQERGLASLPMDADYTDIASAEPTAKASAERGGSSFAVRSKRDPGRMPVIRKAVRADVPGILALIKELATYEREPDAVLATEEDLLRDGFSDRPAFHVLVAEDAPGGAVIGFALYFFSYSTWVGRRCLYLEDLFVVPARRGSGAGLALMAALAREAEANDCRRFVWQVLDWNEPALAFYARLGAEVLRPWLSVRLEGDALAALARRAAP